MAEQLAELNKSVKTAYKKGDTVTLSGDSCWYGRISGDRTKFYGFMSIKTDNTVSTVTMSYSGTGYASTATEGKAITAVSVTRENCEQLIMSATLATQASAAGTASTAYFTDTVLTFS